MASMKTPYFDFTPNNLTNQNNLKVNPVFAAATDFHLQAVSPGIEKGIKITGICTDYEGKTPNDPPSIGAFEFTSASPVLPLIQSFCCGKCHTGSSRNDL